MITVDYPNEGVYDNGQPRYVQKDAKGNVVFCRFATPEEAVSFALMQSIDDLRDSLERIGQQIRDVQTYGLRVDK